MITIALSKGRLAEQALDILEAAGYDVSAGREKSRKIDKARDALNAKFGSATIVRGSSIQSKIDVGKKYQAQMEQKKKGKPE